MKKQIIIAFFLIIIILLILFLSLNKDNWDANSITKFDQPKPTFPPGDSLLTINSNGDLSTQLSDTNINSYFKAIDDTISALIKNYNENMSSLQQAYNADMTKLKQQWTDWTTDADKTYIKEGEEILINTFADNWAWVFAQNHRDGERLSITRDMSDWSGNQVSGKTDESTPAVNLGFQIHKKTNKGDGKTWENSGWRCRNGNLSPKCGR
jgi:hypothetical protein